MFNYLSLRATLYSVSISLAILTVACGKGNQSQFNQANSEIRSPNQSASVRVEANSQSGTDGTRLSSSLTQTANEVNLFERGLDKAAGAFSISQSAQSISDWGLVINQYQDAIALMNQVQRGNPYFDVAQSKISEYRRQVEYAQIKTVANRQKSLSPVQKQVVSSASGVNVASKSPTSATGLSQIASRPKSVAPVQVPVPQTKPVQREIVPVYVTQPMPELLQAQLAQQSEEKLVSIPIKRRMGGTPVIEVTFNGNQSFEMIVDTGASGTVITEDMANALGVIPVGKAKANTASSKSVIFPIGYVSSIAVGAVKVNRTAVAIAGSELETGLLGHDFFGNYDITIKRDVVEFRPHVNTSTNNHLANPVEHKPSVPIYP
ncbi:retropepsin-like aspartic protease [Calothrix sp. UHCC 0171]|uniref:retropepsin-like aspartic protease family protein n=1 Tax=Calothrix sp. UHCC 0171 TaxID=3110245 RepID=UPI002B2179E0|nr:retropepsin-like aspartic protease [Calothrix sp. UHCC 0171]MEA5570382.1 retropepsin-like aspartic protease [Calothrix sp. UHCC 0171]